MILGCLIIQPLIVPKKNAMKSFSSMFLMTGVWRTQGENPRIRQYRARFLLEALEELKNKIENLGGQIEFLLGQASEEISKLAAEYGAGHCFAQREDASEEIMT